MRMRRRGASKKWGAITVGALLSLFLGVGALAENTGKRIANADSEPGNWLSYGRTYSEQRYSPLDRVNLQNVKDLGLAWYYDFDESFRPIQATPLVVDGVMFVSEPWSKVSALNAVTGKALWQYDPEVPKEVEVKDCCKAPNRGVAYWNGRVFVGTLDGRLIAIDAKTGKSVWQKVTVDPDWPYVIAGAPRAVKGKIVIGNSGGDLGMRGYISAYDAETGELVWRFYTVPGDPKKGFENDAMKMAAETWTGEWWKFGGGGAVWESIVYDPDLNLLYFGTGNALPWNQKIRSPGGGDNLFTASIVAVDADTGKYAWHYQAVPGEKWDYDNTMSLIVAKLKIAGQDRKVIMQAPKDGFFYVLDAATGKLISAEKQAAMNWASGIDMITGRPIENPAARYLDGKPVRVQPGSSGGHGWYPMAFSPRTGLAYFESSNNAQPYADDPPETKFERGYNNTFACVYCKADDAPNPALPIEKTSYSLLAWDPVNQKQAWREMAPYAGGGVLATAGDLVFQPGSDGNLSAYNAMTGEKLWSAPMQNVGITGPISYSVSGEQYIAIAVGKGYQSTVKSDPVPYPALLPNTNRVLVFKLGGKATLPPVDYTPQPLPPPPVQTASAETIHEGYLVYNHYCFACHGLSADGDRVHPDLKYSTILGSKTEWAQVLEDGARKDAGMVSFKDVVSPEQAEAIRAFVISRAEEAQAKRAPATGPEQAPIH